MQARLVIAPAPRPARPLQLQRRASPSRLADDRAIQAASIGALLAGLATALHYARLGLTLSHYDARAHLVVARRILDNLTPCWEQIGAVWLPLPHLLNALPVQVDAWYRTGASGVAISIVGFVMTTYAIFVLARQLTGSREAALAGAALTALNPNLLYLQATPMTEPLLMGLTTTALALLVEAVRAPRRTNADIAAGACLAGACLTRYEAWPVTAAAAGLAAYAFIRAGADRRDAFRRLGPLVLIPAGAIAAFCVHSRLSTGAWIVTNGFYVPENPATAKPFAAAAAVWWGTHVMTGYVVLLVALVGVTLTAARAFSGTRARLAHLVALSLVAASVLPGFAFYQGHPFRVRYMAALIPAVALFGAVAVGSLGRASRWALALIVAAALVENPPWWSGAAMVREAQWDLGASRSRRTVSEYLSREYDGALVMASMGSLGHYMQELSRVPKPGSRSGFEVADFLHEGNGDIWTAALDDPAPHVGWLLVDEYSEGGDLLAALGRTRPSFLQGLTRVATGGGVVLYRKRTGTVSEPEPK